MMTEKEQGKLEVTLDFIQKAVARIEVSFTGLEREIKEHYATKNNLLEMAETVKYQNERQLNGLRKDLEKQILDVEKKSEEKANRALNKLENLDIESKTKQATINSWISGGLAAIGVILSLLSAFHVI